MVQADTSKSGSGSLRRSRLFAGLGWRLFWFVAFITAVPFAFFVVRTPDLPRLEIGIAFAGVPALVGILALAYLNQTRAARPDFSERANFLFLWLLIWLGQLWLLLLFVFAGLYWASGRGLLTWLPS